MALSTRLFSSIFAVLATCFVFGCGPKKEPEQPKKKASDGLDLGLMGEVSSTEGSPAKGGDDLDEPFSPCGKKKCGDVCTTCDPVEESCVELQVLRQCNLKGECVVAPAQCTASAPEDKGKDKGKDKAK